MMLNISVVIIIIAIIFFIWIHSASLDSSNSDVLIILGYKCINNNIHPLLEERLKVSNQLTAINSYKKIIVTGGKVASDISEAVIMKEYLISNGVNKDCIILEMEASDTIENMINCKEIAIKAGFNTCTVISNSFHLRRIIYICNKIGFPVKVYCERNLDTLKKQIKLTFSEARIFIFVFLALKKLKDKKDFHK
ncbi:MAG: hypothetical protein K0R09_2091 [Clostridiales bacterium]|nr:hypothetical protein [Clostridiales bacterium]